MPKVKRRENESDEQLLRRFRKKVSRSGVLVEVRRRRWHVSDSELRRIARDKAIRRMRRNSKKKR